MALIWLVESAATADSDSEEICCSCSDTIWSVVSFWVWLDENVAIWDAVRAWTSTVSIDAIWAAVSAAIACVDRDDIWSADKSRI
jgi:hypothetical protein